MLRKSSVQNWLCLITLVFLVTKTEHTDIIVDELIISV